MLILIGASNMFFKMQNAEYVVIFHFSIGYNNIIERLDFKSTGLLLIDIVKKQFIQIFSAFFPSQCHLNFYL